MHQLSVRLAKLAKSDASECKSGAGLCACDATSAQCTRRKSIGPLRDRKLER